jgi:hypothetical protein
MASILAAQKNNEENTVSTDSIKPAEPQNRAPRSLFNLFTAEECEELGLSTYDK